MSQTALEMTNVVSAKTKGTKKLPLFRNEGERGFGTKKVASTERPGRECPGLCMAPAVGGWLGAEGVCGRRCRKSPTLEAAQSRQEEPSKLGGSGKAGTGRWRRECVKGSFRDEQVGARHRVH